MIRRIAWAIGAVAAAVPLQSVFHMSVGTGPGVAAVVGVMAAALAPDVSLALLAALLPIADVGLNLISRTPGSLHFGELLVLAWITGWSIRRAVTAEPLHVDAKVKWTVAALAAAVAASTFLSARIMLAEDVSAQTAFPGFLFRTYLLDLKPLSAGLQMLEGLVILLATTDACTRRARARETLVRMLVFGAGAAAFMNIARVLEVSFRQEHAWQQFLTYFVILRVNVHYPDLNAAGSYFAMTLFTMLAVTGRGRAAVIGVIGPLLLVALWLSGSRTAMAACGIVAFALIASSMWKGVSRRRLVAVAALVVLVAAAAATVRWYPQRRDTATATGAMEARTELAKAALRMTAEAPVFGVGVGRYYVLSAEYIGRVVEYLGKQHENAHNYYLQVLAELGVPGLLMFLAVLAATLLPAAKTAASGREGRMLLAGATAFLLTCFGGHPLLIPVVAYAFWMTLGATASLTPPAGSSAGLRGAGIALAVMYAASIPFRTGPALRSADMANVSVGLSRWQPEVDGTRFRWAGSRAWFFAPSWARVVRVPVRHGSIGSDDLLVTIAVDGRVVNQIKVPPGAGWTTETVMLTRVEGARYVRLEFETRSIAHAGADVPATDTSGILMIGKPGFEQ